MFRDMFEGFSKPFFKNMRQAIGGAQGSDPVELDASSIEPTVETPAVPESEAVTQAASGAKAEGKPIVEPFTDVFYDAEGNLVGTLEVPGATDETLHVEVHGKKIRVEAEGLLRKYAKVIDAEFEPDPAKVTGQITNGICELRVTRA
jgi:HSP20 family molecular chaperone IbpA